eukprot:bmy_09434T0
MGVWCDQGLGGDGLAGRAALTRFGHRSSGPRSHSPSPRMRRPCAGWLRAALQAGPAPSSVSHVGSRKERPVQRLQFPCGEPGQELPPITLLPLLAAVGQCCSRGMEKPGTLLSHCRCRWMGPGRRRQRPHCPAARGEGQDTAPSSLCPDVVFRESVPRRPCPLGP